MLLRLNKGGTIITLSGDGAVIRAATYIPRTPNLGEEEIREMLRGGHWAALDALRVAETASVILEGTAVAMLAQVREIQALMPLYRARYDNERLWVEYRAEDSGNTYRAEILKLDVPLPEVPIGPRLDSGVLEIIVGWEREFSWADTVETEVGLDNGSTATPTIGGVAIRNHHDTGTDTNIVDIAAADITGVIPAPCRIVLRNEAAASVAYDNVYIGHNFKSGPLTFDHILEGEANEAGGGSVLPSVADNTNYSGGFYYERTWATSIAHSSVLYSYTIPGSQLESANGGWFRLLARFATAPNSTTRVKVTLLHQTAFKLYETPEVKLSGDLLQDLGTIQLPPALAGLAFLGDIMLRITARDTVAGSLSIDFIQLTPLDGWRHLQTLGGTYATNTELVDDGMADLLYTDEGGTDKYANLVAEGHRILLWPGRAQRLYFLFDEATTMNIQRLSDVQVFYRPRRLSL